MPPSFPDPRFIEGLTTKLGDVLKSSPAADLEKNLKAALSGLFARMELVTREEFDVQAEVLARTRAKLVELEQRLARLEGASGTAADDATPTEGAPV